MQEEKTITKIAKIIWKINECMAAIPAVIILGAAVVYMLYCMYNTFCTEAILVAIIFIVIGLAASLLPACFILFVAAFSSFIVCFILECITYALLYIFYKPLLEEYRKFSVIFEKKVKDDDQ